MDAGKRKEKGKNNCDGLLVGLVLCGREKNAPFTPSGDASRHYSNFTELNFHRGNAGTFDKWAARQSFRQAGLFLIIFFYCNFFEDRFWHSLSRRDSAGSRAWAALLLGGLTAARGEACTEAEHFPREVTFQLRSEGRRE